MMIKRLVRPLIILPGTVLVIVPAVLLWVTRGSAFEAETAHFDDLRLWLAVLLGSVGLLLATWTCRLFINVGEGTPAPWDPPRKLVVRGAYRHVRNPMISGVLFLLAAEALVFNSWPLLGWLVMFFLANAIYFPLSEEKDLERRFGEDYRRYKANVPRWIPRLRPWQP